MSLIITPNEYPLTFSTGLTRSITNTITNNLSVGVSGGQTAIGGTASGNSLTLSSTSHATKGKILFGTSAYDEVNNRLIIGATSSSTDGLTVIPASGSIGFVLQTGGGGGCMKIGANVNATTLTASTRMLARICMPYWDAGATNVMIFSGDVTGANASDVYFGGTPGGSQYAATGLHFVTALTGTTTGGVEKMTIDLNGNVGIGQTSPTALLHIKAGTATANTAPLKFTSGTNLTTAVAGVMEYDGTNLFFTRTGTTRESVICSNAVNSVSPTSPNRTITVVIAGTTYYLAAKTTND